MSFQVSSETATIPDFLNLPFLEALRDAIAALIGVIVDALQIGIDALEVVQAFLLDILNPIAVLLDLIIQDIETLLQTWEDAGVSVAYVIPDLSNLYTAEACFTKLAQSLEDPFDTRRPITTDGIDVPLFMVCLTMQANAGLTGLEEFLRLIESLLDIRPFVQLYEDAVFGRQPDLPRGQSQLPDWQGAKLVDYVPGLKNVIDVLQYLLSLIKLNLPFNVIIKRLIALLEQKQQTLQAIVDLLNNAIDAYGAIAGLTFSAVFIDGEGTRSELADALREAGIQVLSANQETAQSESAIRLGAAVGDFTNIGAVVAAAATGTSVEALKVVFGRS